MIAEPLFKIKITFCIKQNIIQNILTLMDFVYTWLFYKGIISKSKRFELANKLKKVFKQDKYM